MPALNLPAFILNVSFIALGDFIVDFIDVPADVCCAGEVGGYGVVEVTSRINLMKVFSHGDWDIR